MARKTAPAGWYPDPRGEPVERYWTGGKWTNHTQAAPNSAQRSTARTVNSIKWLLIVAVVLVLLGVALYNTFGGS